MFSDGPLIEIKDGKKVLFKGDINGACKTLKKLHKKEYEEYLKHVNLDTIIETTTNSFIKEASEKHKNRYNVCDYIHENIKKVLKEKIPNISVYTQPPTSEKQKIELIINPKNTFLVFYKLKIIISIDGSTILNILKTEANSYLYI